MTMVEELQFSQAKERLSEVMDEVVHRDRLKAVRGERGEPWKQSSDCVSSSGSRMVD